MSQYKFQLLMTSSRENLPKKEQDPHSSELEQINNLIDFLIESNRASSEKIASQDKAENTLEVPAKELHSQQNEFAKGDFAAADNFSREKAVKYQEFLQQTVEIKAESISEQNQPTQSALDLQIDSPAEVDFSFLGSQETNSSSSSSSTDNSILGLTSEVDRSDLIDSVNLLIPLIVELLKYKIEESQESIIQGVSPVLDRIIEQRSLEDSPKMAAALAKILPQAISEGINLTPESIAKAIAPELALCITEQIRLDENAISEALGSEMGKAIKTQIELEKDAMVDALYPVIGSTISKYMVEVVQDINRKVDSALSPEGIKRKIQAKMQGVSEAELIFCESVGYYVQAAFLIDKDSGIVIQEVKRAEGDHLDSGMIAGMLTAIRSFANDCIASGSELDEIDYGDFQIPIEAAGYCYLAVVIKGEPSKEFRTKIRKVLGDVVLHYGDAISNFQGDISAIPPQVKLKLSELIEDKNRVKQENSAPPMLLLLVAFILGIIFIPWGIIRYRHHTARNIEQAVAVKFDASPQLSIYRLDSDVRQGTLTISGKVPSKYLQDRAAIVAGEIATENNLQLDNQIVAIKTPQDPSLTQGEVQRLTRVLNQKSETTITTQYNVATKTLTVKGFVFNSSEQKYLSEVFEQIPGIEKIILNLQTQLPKVTTKIYFDLGSDWFDFKENSSKIDSVNQFLQLYPQLYLRLRAHTDGQGSVELNQTLSQQRCQNVKAALEARGVDSAKLITTQCKEPVMPQNSDRADWLFRYVSFEAFIP